MRYIVYGCIKEAFAVPVEAESEEEAVQIVQCLPLVELDDYISNTEVEAERSVLLQQEKPGGT